MALRLPLQRKRACACADVHVQMRMCRCACADVHVHISDVHVHVQKCMCMCMHCLQSALQRGTSKHLVRPGSKSVSKLLGSSKHLAQPGSPLPFSRRLLSATQVSQSVVSKQVVSLLLGAIAAEPWSSVHTHTHEYAYA